MKKRINNKEKSHLQHALTLVVLVARLVPNSQVYTYLWWYDVACNRAELIKAQEPEKKCQETNAKRTSRASVYMCVVFHVKYCFFFACLVLLLLLPLPLPLLLLLLAFSPGCCCCGCRCRRLLLLLFPCLLPSLSSFSFHFYYDPVHFRTYTQQAKAKISGERPMLLKTVFQNAFCACPSMVHSFKSRILCVYMRVRMRMSCKSCENQIALLHKYTRTHRHIHSHRATHMCAPRCVYKLKTYRGTAKHSTALHSIERFKRIGISQFRLISPMPSHTHDSVVFVLGKSVARRIATNIR